MSICKASGSTTCLMVKIKYDLDIMFDTIVEELKIHKSLAWLEKRLDGLKVNR